MIKQTCNNKILEELTSPKIAPDAPTAGILQNR